jgi:hypothetical protein
MSPESRFSLFLALVIFLSAAVGAAANPKANATGSDRPALCATCTVR